MGITNPTEEYFKDGLWGFDGTRWQKLPMVWGFSASYAEEKKNVNMPAGNSNVIGSVVPAGEVWRITGASVMFVSASCTKVKLVYNATPAEVIVQNVIGMVSGLCYPVDVDITAVEGEYVFARFHGMTLADDAFLHLWGYKMAIS